MAEEDLECARWLLWDSVASYEALVLRGASSGVIKLWHPLSTIPDTHGRCQNPASTHLLRSTMIAEYVPFSSDKRYATTQVKAPPKLQKTINYLRVQGDVRVSTVSHGFVYEPYALHEKIPWWRRCLYMTSGSLRSLYSTQELAGVSVSVLNFLQRI
ncbi:hypothetical protein F2Q68_00039063 [Brassica cretica]|uniref:Uncharacterized protein n=1 Tax=Brassica cretica TaxID=69181 RepID=A0A8S9MLP5_BRACR|nr:hypothetical protein F2Q68_00039063 [Brassica cretica]